MCRGWVLSDQFDTHTNFRVKFTNPSIYWPYFGCSYEWKLNPFLHPHQPIILAISLVWLVIGVRQWFVLSKWDKKYKQFKENQKEIDKKFEDDSDDEDNSNALDEK